MPLTREEILAADGDPAILDQVEMRTEKGYPVARIGLGAEFYVAFGDVAAVRNRTIDATQLSFRQFGDKVNRYLIVGRRGPRSTATRPNPVMSTSTIPATHEQAYRATHLLDRQTTSYSKTRDIIGG